jgi:flavin-dependent dehydrogenase
VYDAIVIGARCAGAVTAMLLARRGHRVLLLDLGDFPSDVPQGHFIHRHGPKRLADWGLLERVVGTNCPALTTHLSDFGDFPLIGRDIRMGNMAWGYAPRRRPLDQGLVEAAVEAGAEFRSNFLMESCLWDGDRVKGIRGRDHRQHTTNTEIIILDQHGFGGASAVRFPREFRSNRHAHACPMQSDDTQ